MGVAAMPLVVEGLEEGGPECVAHCNDSCAVVRFIYSTSTSCNAYTSSDMNNGSCCNDAGLRGTRRGWIGMRRRGCVPPFFFFFFFLNAL